MTIHFTSMYRKRKVRMDAFAANITHSGTDCKLSTKLAYRLFKRIDIMYTKLMNYPTVKKPKFQDFLDMFLSFAFEFDCPPHNILDPFMEVVNLWASELPILMLFDYIRCLNYCIHEFRYSYPSNDILRSIHGIIDEYTKRPNEFVAFNTFFHKRYIVGVAEARKLYNKCMSPLELSERNWFDHQNIENFDIDSIQQLADFIL